MDEERKPQAPVNEQPQKTRRALVKTAAQVAVTAPVVMVLLAAGTKSSKAQALYGGGANNGANNGAVGGIDDTHTNNTTDGGPLEGFVGSDGGFDDFDKAT
jgi:hypothetical protein